MYFQRNFNPLWQLREKQLIAIGRTRKEAEVEKEVKEEIYRPGRGRVGRFYPCGQNRLKS